MNLGLWSLKTSNLSADNFKNHAIWLGWQLIPRYGTVIPVSGYCFDSCQLTTTCMCNIRLQASKLARNWKISLWCGRTSGRGNGRAYGHVTTKFSRMDSLPHFLSFRKYSRLSLYFTWHLVFSVEALFADC